MNLDQKENRPFFGKSLDFRDFCCQLTKLEVQHSQRKPLPTVAQPPEPGTDSLLLLESPAGGS